MSEFRCVKVIRSRYIARETVFDIKSEETFGRVVEKSVTLRPEFEELGKAFLRHKAVAVFQVPEKKGPNSELTTFGRVREQIKDFCQNHATGYWTWYQVNRRRDEESREYTIQLFFEHEVDLETFMRDCGLMLKLTHLHPVIDRSLGPK